MIAQDQTKFPQRGNCFRACLASILEIKIEEIPPFEDQSLNCWIPAKAWLIDRGWNLVDTPPTPPRSAVGVGFLSEIPKNLDSFLRGIISNRRNYHDATFTAFYSREHVQPDSLDVYRDINAAIYQEF